MRNFVANPMKINLQGNQKVLGQLGSMMVDFKVGFEILPGTKAKDQEVDTNDFEAAPLADFHE